MFCGLFHISTGESLVAGVPQPIMPQSLVKSVPLRTFWSVVSSLPPMRLTIPGAVSFEKPPGRYRKS
jgi:hypothetical protein